MFIEINLNQKMETSQTSSPPFSERALVLVPTCNPGSTWPDFLKALHGQVASPHKVVILDSESSDGCALLAKTYGYLVQTVRRATFNHGGTRQNGIEQHAQGTEFVVFLTQDAVLAHPNALSDLLQAFEDPQVAAVYGRQLPHLGATPIAAHARLFNYPSESHTVTLQDKNRKGIKTCFLSNSFAAYRLSTLQQLGGFAKNVILGEDMHLAARLLVVGHAIRYQASACVYHSHNYSFREELGRYFDTGVFHAQQSWLLQTFGRASNEGMKFVRSEIRYLMAKSIVLLPEAMLRTLVKYAGFRLGQWYAHWPLWLSKGISMHKGYWV